MTLQSLRQAVAVVQQDSFLFTTTIENNIAYGDPWAKRDSASSAPASRAQLHNYVLGLPTGYHTVVGERGVSLSGGQRQRLSIARSLMLQARGDGLRRFHRRHRRRHRAAHPPRPARATRSDRVTIIIAHRLGSLMHADRILFLEDGRDRRARHATTSCWRSAAATARSTTCSSCPATTQVSA